MSLRRLGNIQTGIQETTPGELDFRAGGEEVAQADANGLKTEALFRHKNEIPSGDTWTIASSENAVLVGPLTATGSLVVNGTLVII